MGRGGGVSNILLFLQPLATVVLLFGGFHQPMTPTQWVVAPHQLSFWHLQLTGRWQPCALLLGWGVSIKVE